MLRYLLPLLIVSAQLHPQTVSSDSSGAAIMRVLSRQVEDWNRGDIRAYMSGYWRSDSLVFTSGGKVSRGWDQALDKYLRSYDTREKMGTLTFSDLEVHRLSDDAAWIFGRWRLERGADRPGGVFTLLFRRFSEGWKIVLDHTSAEPPPPSGKSQ